MEVPVINTTENVRMTVPRPELVVSTIFSHNLVGEGSCDLFSGRGGGERGERHDIREGGDENYTSVGAFIYAGRICNA
jgi:hypothetical protein